METILEPEQGEGLHGRIEISHVKLQITTEISRSN
jgi:hypothetical protein